MFSALKLRQPTNTRKDRKRSGYRGNRSMTMESMEDRKMFAADFMIADTVQVAQISNPGLQLTPVYDADIDLQNGVLNVLGTLNDDVVTIEELPALSLTTIASAQNGWAQNRSIRASAVGTASVLFDNGPRIKVTIAETDGDVLESATFSKSDVNSISVSTYNGDDDVRNDTDVVSSIYGGWGADVLRGGSSADTIYGHAGEDVIFGNEGNDYLDGGDQANSLYGGDGHDTLVGGSHDDYMNGGAGNDLMSGAGGDDNMYGGTDDDSMYGDSGNDNIDGNSGNDLVSGEAGNDTVNGSYGHDFVYGGTGSDTLYGSSGDDTLYGGSSSDEMFGGSGDDYLSGSFGSDEMDGGSGNDTMYGGSGSDDMEGGSGNDYINGGSGNDTLHGQSGNDSLYGQSGKDNLYGGSSNDYLHGGSGDDGLYGGSGTDELRGSSGDDRFLVLNDVPIQVLGITVGQTTADTLLDKNANDAKINFQHGEGKTFNFSGGRWSEIADGTFTPAEIEQIDEALADLHHQVGNTKLLKRKNGSEITVERLGAQTDGNFNLGGVNSGSKITVLDATFNGSQSKLSRIMFHEIGHNWDNENDNWDDWKAISDWQDDFFWPWESTSGLTESTDGDWYYDSSATFARDYGRTNPMEDFATYFAKVMMEENGMTYPWSGSNAAKDVFMDDFLASL